jgi:hypothetical protein
MAELIALGMVTVCKDITMDYPQPSPKVSRGGYGTGSETKR